MSEALLRPDALARRQPLRRRKRAVAFGLGLALLKATVLVGAPVALAAWVLTSPYFLVGEIVVRSGPRVSEAWVAETLAPLAGRHILAVGLEGVRARLAAHPWVETVELHKELPQRLVVDVVERRAAALREDGPEPVFVDEQGRPIAAASPQARSGPEGGPLLRVRPAAPSAAVPMPAVRGLLRELAAAAPGWGAEVEQVEVLADGDFRLTVRGLPFTLVLRRGQVAEAVERLERVRESRGVDGSVAEVDLRFARRVILTPGDAARRSGGGGGDETRDSTER